MDVAEQEPKRDVKAPTMLWNELRLELARAGLKLECGCDRCASKILRGWQR